MTLPTDIGGYQHVVFGPTQEGDIFVHDGVPVRFLTPYEVSHLNCEGEHNGGGVGYIYRKVPVPSNKDDKAQWGEVDRVGFDSLTPHDIERLGKRPGELMSEALRSDLAILEARVTSKYFIPQDDAERKNAPMARGLLHYFPAALFAVATHSMDSDRKHNPGSADGPTWARKKSSDHADCIIRHMIDAGRGETGEEVYHLTAIAWRSLAQLQEALEKRGSKPGISSR